ncbi:histidine phosphatase family protein [Aquimarina sp. 2201CG5-10]|uniref:SixA phosphatase family protein n=1 Tax=Aquimarina callyspongiae TaxID=3098150 RepID=UPI002AB58283|nr:histidine phosphatase family protein [Aquimarina sp. 2201CG5-10]MDY8138244.1 histidine phosphatase family protein [Aquimarina sp. 2201CG5-10]
MKITRSFFLLSFFLFGLIAQAQSSDNTTTYFFIRHAEKDLSDPNNRNPHLTQEGKTRAQNWSHILSNANIDMVFSTDYYRTLETANPIANSKNLKVTLYDPRDLYNSDFQQKTKGKTVVIVGHSNTTPAFVNKILKQKKHSSIDEKDYGKLFVVTISANNTIIDTVLNY